MAQPVARIGDTVTIGCSVHGTVSGTLQTGSPTTKADGIAVCRLNDTGVLSCGHPFKVISSSAVSSADGIHIARVTDQVQITSGASGTGTIVTGSPTTSSN